MTLNALNGDINYCWVLIGKLFKISRICRIRI